MPTMTMSAGILLVVVAAQHALDVATAFEGGDRRAGMDVHAPGLVQMVVELGHAFGGHPLQNAALHLQHVDLEPVLHRDRGHLQTDVAAADDHQTLAGREVGADILHVVDAAQIVDAAQVVAGDGQLPGPGAGREQQFLVGEGFAGIRGYGLCCRVDGDHPRVGLDRDVLVLVELGRPQVHAFEAVLPRQVLLGQRWPLVGNVRLVADDDDLPFIAFLAQARRRLSRGVPRPHDHHRRHVCSSSRKFVSLPGVPVPTNAGFPGRHEPTAAAAPVIGS